MKKSLKTALRAVALCLATVILFVSASVLAGCSGKNPEVNDRVLARLGDYEVEVWFYEFLLSRMKAELARSKYDVKSEKFWNTDIGDGRTWQTVCEETVIDSVKMYLVGMAMFDENKLELSKDYDKSIKEEIDYFIEYDADDSENQMNRILAPFGVDTKSLADAYRYEYLASLVRMYLYGTDGGLVGRDVKEQFFRDNYYCFKQILIPTFYYENVVDEAGNTVYFDSETGHIKYDKENGKPHYDNIGAAVTDGDGEKIYYGEDGNPIYDTKNGVTQYVADTDGSAKRYFYGDDEVKNIRQKAEGVLSKIGNEPDFEYQMQLNDSAEEGRNLYKNGYYLSDLESANFTDDYLKDILSWLKDAKVGDIKMFESKYGFHIVLKKDVTAGDYEVEDYKMLFTNYSSGLTNELFTEKCRSRFDEIKLDENALKSAKSIVNIGINYNY